MLLKVRKMRRMPNRQICSYIATEQVPETARSRKFALATGSAGKKHHTISGGTRMKKKTKKVLLITVICVALLFSFSTTAFAAGEDMFQVADNIIRDVYTHIAGISTILAALMSAIAVIGAKMSNNQHKVDQSWDWLKRIWIAWAVINGIGAFIAYVAPLLDGYNVLP